MRNNKNLTSLLILGLGFIFWAQPSLAIEENEMRAGLMGGNASLLGDVGTRGGGNGLATGAVLNYAVTDEIIFEAAYLASKHDSVDHSDISLGINLNLSNYDVMYGYVSGGASFLSNEFKTVTPLTGSAFGIYVGAGLDFELGRRFVLGLQAKHQKAFEASSTVNGVATKTVQDSSTVLIKFMMAFGGDGW